MDVAEFNYLKDALARLPEAWLDFLLNHHYSLLRQIDKHLSSLHERGIVIYPDKPDIFAALQANTVTQIKLVILGQDPYHTPLVANGFAFASKRAYPLPPSLVNIYKELSLEYGLTSSSIAPDLIQSWTNQGVLLLNSSLTVIKSQANSLANIGWQLITDSIIEYISNTKEHVVFMLWGNYAISKAGLINQNKHLLLKTTHPSPFSAHKGFLGCNHFKLANEYLVRYAYEPIKFC